MPTLDGLATLRLKHKPADIRTIMVQK